jgi:hypothetical protein
MYNTNINDSIFFITICCISFITINTASADNNEIYPKQPADYLYTFDLSTLDYHDINTILKRGNSREKQLIIKYLIKERYNPKNLDLLISYYINIDRNDLAKYWVKWGKDNSIEIKPWQRLHIAIIQKDKIVINRILRNEKNKLPQSMINDALVTLNKDNKALSNAQNYIDSNTSYQTDSAQQHHVNSLGISTSNNIITTVFSENYGALNIDSANITGEIKTGDYTVSITGIKNILNTDDSDSFYKENIDNEYDLSVKANKRFNRSNLSFGIGNNIRASDTINYALLKYEYQYSDEIDGLFAIDYNKITYTSTALRALGYKNQASVGLNIKPTNEYIINVNLNSHEYKTRKDDTIGSGYGINASLNHILSFTPYYWDVSIRTSVEDNNLKSSIPSYIVTTQINQPDDIIGDDYSFIGFGTIYKYGFLDNSHYLTNNISFNIYTGLIFPGESINYGLDIKYGYAFTPLNLLGFEVVYSNAFNSIEGNEYTKLALYYQYNF